MSAIKIKSGETWTAINSVVVNNNNVVQQSGTSITNVMSQSAVTKMAEDIISLIPNKDEYAKKSYVDDLVNSVPLGTAGATAIADMTCARLFGTESPVLADYYGNKEALYKVLDHFKIGTFDKDGKLTNECAPGRLTVNKSGVEVAIDGSMGDVMLYTDIDIYRDRSSMKGMTVNGSTGTTASTYNVLGLSLKSHSVAGKNAKKFEPFAFTPHYTVNTKLDGDSETQQHSIYNTNVAGTYTAATVLFTTQYRSNGKGFPTTHVSSLQSSENARKKGGDYMGLYYDFYEVWLTAMYLELGTLDFTNSSYFGNGCTKYYPTASDWFSDSVPGNSGVLTIHNGTASYEPLMYDNYGTGGNTGKTYNNAGLVSSSDYYNFTECLEAQRIMDGITKAGLTASIGGTNLFTYDANGDVVTATGVNVTTGEGMEDNKKYFTVRNVGTCQGLADGVMTGVVNIYMKKIFATNVMRLSVNVGGDTAIWKFSHPVYRGLDLLSGMFTQLEGAYWVMNNSGSTDGCTHQEFYYAENWDDVPKDITTASGYSVSPDNSEPMVISGLERGIVTTTNTNGWVSSTDYNMSLFAHTAFGAAQHTYECGYCWKDGHSYYAPNIGSNNYPKPGYRYANASVVGCRAHVGYAGRTLRAYHSVSVSFDYYAGGFAHPQISF